MLKHLVVVLTVFGVTLGLPTGNDKTPEGRILGGHETTVHEHPYQLALFAHTRYTCGAVLISHDWAITTAHCVDSWPVSSLSVRAGSTRMSAGGQVADVSKVFLHGGYNRRTLDYNFAILELKGSIAVRDATPALLAEANRPIVPGEHAVITGWGQTYLGSSYPEILQVADVSIVDLAVCRGAYGGYNITDRMFCGGVLGVEGIDATHGDRGGPVVINGRLVGIISWAINHGSPDRPDVYGSIPSVRDWIRWTAGV